MVQPDFLEAAVRVLEPGGRWLVQSDHEEYFGIIRELLGGHPSLCEIAWDDAGVDPGPDWQGTNFEIKYARERREIFKVAYLRR
jgi:tRNA G46 methylase TrmB